MDDAGGGDEQPRREAPHRTRAFLGNDEATASREAARYIAADPGWVEESREWDERRGRLTVRFVLAPPGAAPTRPAAGPPASGWTVTRTEARVPRAAIVVVLALIVVAGIGAAWFGGQHLDEIGAFATPRFTPGPTATRDGEVVPRLARVECRFQPTSGRATECWDLVVPEDRSEPAGAVLKVHVARFRTVVAGAEPVVFLNGGPGGTALEDDYDYDDYPFYASGDLIVLDQRGVGESQPSLDCPELDALAWTEEGGEMYLDAMATCRDRLDASGIDRGAYTSAESAADVEDLRKLLGYERWNLYGVSYGTRLALTVLRDHPAGVRSVILDAVLPTHVDPLGEGAANTTRAFDALFEACRADVVCRRDHPALRTEFYDLVARLDEAPLHVQPRGVESGPFYGSDLVTWLFDRMYITEEIPYLPAEIAAIGAGDVEPLERYLEEEERDEWPALYGDADGFSEGVYHSITCAEEAPFTSADRIRELEAGVPEPITYALGSSEALDLCARWRVAAKGSPEDQPVTSDVPTLLLAGELDPVTPPRWAQAAAKTLSRSQLHLFRGVGHGVLPESPCARSVVRDFLRDPARGGEAACVKAVERAPFRPTEARPSP